LARPSSRPPSGGLLADLGRCVLLLEVDPRESLHQVFDVPPSGGEIVRIISPRRRALSASWTAAP
jgi:hypothetical protein